MLALLKDCCSKSFVYHFSFDEVFNVYILPHNIITETEYLRTIRITRIPFEYISSNLRGVSFYYLFEEGVVHDSLNPSYGTVPFILRKRTMGDLHSLDISRYFNAFCELLSLNRALIDNCIPADLDLRGKILDFMSSLDITSFYYPNSTTLNQFALANFIHQNFNHKIHIKFSCDIVHIKESFPAFSLVRSQILEVKNFNFEVNII